MIGDRTVNYAANKMQSAGIAFAAPDIKIAASNSEQTLTKKKNAAAKIIKEETAKAPVKRGRGRPAGSKNKKGTKAAAVKTVKVAKKASVAKPKVATKPAKKTAPTATNNINKVKTETVKRETENNKSETQNTEKTTHQTAEAVKDFSQEITAYLNKVSSDNMAFSRELFSCRTMTDLFEIQNKMLKQNIDNFFQQSAKMTELFSKASSETTAPLNSTLTSYADEWKKKFSA